MDKGLRLKPPDCPLAMPISHAQGAMDVEMRLTPAGPRLIEINARMAGGAFRLMNLLVGRCADLEGTLQLLSKVTAQGDVSFLTVNRLQMPLSCQYPSAFAENCYLQTGLAWRSMAGLLTGGAHISKTDCACRRQASSFSLTPTDASHGRSGAWTC